MNKQQSQSSSGSDGEPSLDGHYSVLNKFEPLESLGKGGFGAVFKVKDKVNSEIYAVKCTRNENQKYRSREAKILEKLHQSGPHNQIINYHGYWVDNVDNSIVRNSSESSQSRSLSKSRSSSLKDQLMDWDEIELVEFANLEEKKNNDGKTTKEISKNVDMDFLTTESFVPAADVTEFLYVQLEYCSGGTLRSKIDNGTLHLSKKECFGILIGIAEGLSFIHENGIIHRDLNPCNILFDEAGNPKIADFGMATSIMSVNSEERMDFGTPELGASYYIAPELRVPEKLAIYNEKVDVYSLGIIFFEMVHGPMQTMSERDAVLEGVRGNPIVLPKLQMDHQLKILLRRMLSHESVTRPSSAEIPSFLHAFIETIKD